MRERAALLNIVAELRGRLDDLEAMIRTAPNQAIITPSSYDEEGVVDLTPEAYRAFRARGQEKPQLLKRYQPVQSFAQFGAPPDMGQVLASSFPLSELHRVGPDAAHGLRLEPQDAAQQGFFTYEFLADAEGLEQYRWTEWVLKLSLERPYPCYTQVILEGDGFSERLDVGPAPVSDFPAFRHVRLDRAKVMEAAAGRPLRRMRLTLSTGGTPLALDLYSLALYGRSETSLEEAP